MKLWVFLSLSLGEDCRGSFARLRPPDFLLPLYPGASVYVNKFLHLHQKKGIKKFKKK